MATSLSRRSFIGGAGAAALAAAGAGASAAAAEEQAPAEPAAAAPSFLERPAVPDEVSQSLACDVLVVGLGPSGVCAALAAAEAGASVIAVDKQPEFGTAMAGEFGVVGSKIQEELGIEWASKGDVVGQLMKDMCYRPNPRLLNYWYDHSGEAFDWLIEGADYELLPTSLAQQTTDKNKVYPKLFPPLEGYDWREEYYPYFHGTIDTGLKWICAHGIEKAQAAGAQVLYGQRAEQLVIDESGAVTGAYLYDADGAYTRVDAKAVVLCTGDMSNNKEMMSYYVPWAADFSTRAYTVRDFEDNPANTGDGQRMGIWAGGRMELGPHAAMTHHMGGALGVDAFLQLNAYGERFMNEDVPGQNIQDQLSRQPFGYSWQIFDDLYPEELAAQGTGHGFANYFVPAEQEEELAYKLSSSMSGYVSRTTVDERVTAKADTLEELCQMIELPYDVVAAQVQRYNELCEKGVDEDFGKVATRMFPVSTPPFYACKFQKCSMLVCMGGLVTDLDLRVLDAGEQPVAGLYTAGNCMGGRFLVEYPVTVAGISLGTAITFGRLAGENAAAFAAA